MKITCPACGSVASLEVFLTHDSARESILLAMRFPAPLGTLVVRYLGLFRSEKTHQLTFDKVAKLLGELLPLIEAGQFERNRSTWIAPMEYWRTGIEKVLEKRDTLNLPLDGHGYLLEIVASLSNRAEAREERKQEQAKKDRQQRQGESPAPVNPSAPPTEFQEALRALTGKTQIATGATSEEQRRQDTLQALERAQAKSTGA